MRVPDLIRAAAIVSCVSACNACQSRGPRADTAGVRSAAVHGSVQDRLSSADSISLTAFLNTKHLRLDTVLALRPRVAVLAVHHDSSAFVATVQRDSSGFHQLGPDVPINGLAYPKVQLAPLGQGGVLRVISFNDLAEGVVGTAVDRIDAGGSLRREFGDPGATCKAADFMSDGGGYTLHQYLDSPFAADCLSECAEGLRTTVKAEPAKVVALRRTQDGWKTTPETDSAAVQQSRNYARITAALHSGQLPECSADSARILAKVANWQRAMSR